MFVFKVFNYVNPLKFIDGSHQRVDDIILQSINALVRAANEVKRIDAIKHVKNKDLFLII